MLGVTVREDGVRIDCGGRDHLANAADLKIRRPRCQGFDLERGGFPHVGLEKRKIHNRTGVPLRPPKRLLYGGGFRRRWLRFLVRRVVFTGSSFHYTLLVARYLRRIVGHSLPCSFGL